ncbi:MAG: tetratricopeptide repeat protein [Proteobacteria bacterium]|nr:tetratricopeptide repeat protein [Pseudomonadota bacterium]
MSPARLRYWKRTSLLPPQLAPEPGFGFRDLVGVKRLLRLLDEGVPLRRIRNSVEALRLHMPELEEPLAALALTAGRVAVLRDGVWIEPEGQLVIDFGTTPAAPSVAELPPEAGEAEAEEEESALDWFELGCRLDSEPAGFDQAVEAYRRALELDPEFADAQCNLGAVYYNLGRKAEARACFAACLELDPQHVEAHFNLANLLEEEGCNERALGHYRSALGADPFYSDLHVNLALLYEKMGLPRRAREHWRRYLQLDPSGSWAEVAQQRLRCDG